MQVDFWIWMVGLLDVGNTIEGVIGLMKVLLRIKSVERSDVGLFQEIWCLEQIFMAVSHPTLIYLPRPFCKILKISSVFGDVFSDASNSILKTK